MSGWPAQPGWRWIASLAAALALTLGVLLGPPGCRSAQDYRREADQTAYQIIQDKQQEGLGRTEPFTIERPADTLRQRLLLDQHLPISHPGSLGSVALEPTEHWPDDPYLDPASRPERDLPLEVATPLRISFEQALQIAARNSREYQSRKEGVYLAALNLDLERDEFRNTFAGLLEGLFSSDQTPGNVTTGVEATAQTALVRRFKSGVTLTTRIALDLAKLLTMDRPSSYGVLADATIEIPLLRGAGQWVVTEPLTQAEREALYAIYDFEQFKREFAVNIASEYLLVLRQMDSVENAEENYRRLITAARRARRLADAGRLPEIQVDQAVQDELRARDRWIAAGVDFARQLDAFKILLGLPADAQIELDRGELERLTEATEQMLSKMSFQEPAPSHEVLPADAPVELEPPREEDRGPLELDEDEAIRLALENRQDLWVVQGRVYDAQRQVAVAANAFLPDLTLLGSTSIGERRTIDSAGRPDARFEADRGRYDAILSLDLPLERTAERNLYRRSLIDLERAVRDLQALEDSVKFQIRNALRTLMESREGLRIQAQAVALAQRRVESTNLFLEAGRAEIRDLLEAQDALFSAQNALTAALVNYRVAELQLQRDMGVLEVDAEGLWQEYMPQEHSS